MPKFLHLFGLSRKRIFHAVDASLQRLGTDHIDLYQTHRFASMQNHYNLVYREEEREMIPLCRDAGVAIIPWSPLARGFLVSDPNEEVAGEKNLAPANSPGSNKLTNHAPYLAMHSRAQVRFTSS